MNEIVDKEVTMDIQAVLRANRNLSARVSELEKTRWELDLANEKLQKLSERYRYCRKKLEVQTQIDQIIQKDGDTYYVLPILEIRGGIGCGLRVIVAKG